MIIVNDDCINFEIVEQVLQIQLLQEQNVCLTVIVNIKEKDTLYWVSRFATLVIFYEEIEYQGNEAMG